MIDYGKDCCHNNIIDNIRGRELGQRFNSSSPKSLLNLRRDLREIVAAKIPCWIRKDIIRYPYEDKCDKVFASQWIGSDTICFGTKDNQLLLWSLSTGEITNIALPDKYDIAMKPVRSLTPIPIGDPAISSQPSLTETSPNKPLPTTGIHDIHMNPSRTRLVSGGKNDCDMALFSLPTMKPSAILHGHQDCVFASRFISDDIILSGGRDGSLLLWKLPTVSSAMVDDDVSVISPSQCVMRSPFRIRNIEYSTYSNHAYVLCGDCSLAVFDCHSMYQVKCFPLPEESDLVSLALSDENHIIAVGNQGGTNLIDMNDGQSIAELCDIGLPFGVRSLAFNKDLLAIGGGNGDVDFYDVRMLSRRLPHPLKSTIGSVRPTQYCPDVEHCDVQQAIYSVKFDPDYGNKLFVAGGPLMCGLTGCYASIWA